MRTRVVEGLVLVLTVAACKSAPPPPPPPPPPVRDCVADATKALAGSPHEGMKALMGCAQTKEVSTIEPLLSSGWIDAFNTHKQGLQVLALVLATRIDTFRNDLDALRRGGVSVQSFRATIEAGATVEGRLVLGVGVVASTAEKTVRLIELVPTGDARRLTEGVNQIVVTKTRTTPVRMGDELVYLIKAKDVTFDEGTTVKATLEGDLVQQVVYKKSGAR